MVAYWRPCMADSYQLYSSVDVPSFGWKCAKVQRMWRWSSPHVQSQLMPRMMYGHHPAHSHWCVLCLCARSNWHWMFNFNPGNEHVFFAASGNNVICLDMRKDISTGFEKYAFNKEEINQISLSRQSFLAAADDSGEVKIIDVQRHCLYKTLRSGHTNICSSVQFRPHHPWEVISGGLDSKVLLWDFSRGRHHTIIDIDVAEAANTSQMWNPPLVHAIVFPEESPVGRCDQYFAVAKGDGTVELVDLELEIHRTKAKTIKPLRTRKGSKSANDSTFGEGFKPSRIQLHSDLGGHMASVSCVEFSRFGEKGKFLISGSNDSSIKIWDWKSQIESTRAHDHPLKLTIKNKRKVNWLCTTTLDSQNLIVCDTSSIVKAYTIS